MELVKIEAYKYQELDDKAKENFIHKMYDMPFDYEDEDKDGNIITKYDYFADWNLEEQIDFCYHNEYLFDKYGNMIHHLVKGE